MGIIVFVVCVCAHVLVCMRVCVCAHVCVCVCTHVSVCVVGLWVPTQLPWAWYRPTCGVLALPQVDLPALALST